MADSMRVAAIIPARGGSSEVPGKNVRALGIPPLSLLERAIIACKDAHTLTEIWVSSDDPALLGIARQNGIGTIERPPELATHDATTDDVLLHAEQQLDPEVEIIVLV